MVENTSHIPAWLLTDLAATLLYEDAPEFSIDPQYEAALAEYEPDPYRRSQYTNAVKWALGIDFEGYTETVPGRRTCVFKNDLMPAWPVLWIYLWPEGPKMIRLCDVIEP